MQTFAHNKNLCLEIIDIFSINVPILWQEWWEIWTKCQSARISSVIYYTCLDTGLQMFTRGQMNNQDVDSLSKIFVAKYRILTDGRPPSFVKGICILLWKRKWNRIMIHFSDSDMFGWRREQIAASEIEGDWGGGRGGEDEIIQNLGKKPQKRGCQSLRKLFWFILDQIWWKVMIADVGARQEKICQMNVVPTQAEWKEWTLRKWRRKKAFIPFI